MSTRRADRRTAIDILYQADITGADPLLVLADWSSMDDREVAAFTAELIQGVVGHLEGIDQVLESHAQDWTVARMAALDRTILRIAVFELLHRPDVPASAAISEAVEAAAELSSDESRGFVNGILGKLSRELEAER